MMKAYLILQLLSARITKPLCDRGDNFLYHWTDIVIAMNRKMTLINWSLKEENLEYEYVCDQWIRSIRFSKWNYFISWWGWLQISGDFRPLLEYFMIILITEMIFVPCGVPKDFLSVIPQYRFQSGVNGVTVSSNRDQSWRSSEDLNRPVTSDWPHLNINGDYPWTLHKLASQIREIFRGGGLDSLAPVRPPSDFIDGHWVLRTVAAIRRVYL